MICPECKKQGLKSRVYDRGCTVTLMGWSPYYDEEGNYHSHDPNRRTQGYECSNGHFWAEQKYNTCQCGWTNKPSELKEEKNEPTRRNED